MSTNGSRRRRERRARLEQFLEETEEELNGDGSTGTFDDLVIDDQFISESGTLTIPPEDLPVEVGANPIPGPWQGIRRVGMVLNFSFVWDSEEEQWVRDEGNGGEAGVLANEFRANVDPDGDTTVESGSFNTQTVPLATDFGPGFDPDGVIDTTADQFVAPSDGTYFFSHGLSYSDPTTGNTYQSFLFETGVQNHAIQRQRIDAAEPLLTGSTVIQLSAGDAIEWRTAHESSNNEELEDSTAQSYFLGYKIA